MSRYDIVKRKAQRASCCRGCDKGIFKDEDIIYTYSYINRGQNIIFCIECAELIGRLAASSEGEDD